VLRIRGAGATWKCHFLLGACLGAAYLTKVATALPIILIWTLATVSLGRGLRHCAAHLLTLGLGLVLVAGPYVAVLSEHEGHFTLSEAGRLNYAWYVNAIPNHWQGEPAGFGTPAHPHPKIFDNPPAYAFPSDARGTYPGWLDPTHWYKGISPRFDWKGQRYALITNAEQLFQFFLGTAVAGTVVFVVTLHLLGVSWRRAARNFAAQWFLLLPVLLSAVMYSAVWVETRFLAAYAILLFLTVMSAASVEDSPVTRGFVRRMAAAVVIVTLAAAAEAVVRDMYERGRGPSPHWQIAGTLRSMGIREGDRVAVIGYINRCGWARLARVRITAEIPHGADTDFLLAPDSLKAAALRSMFATGVKAVIADHRQASGCPSGWQRIQQTDFHVCKAI
jgi:hypothetical protein